MTKNEALDKCNETIDNEKRKQLLEKRLLRLEKMIQEDIENEKAAKKKSLVERFRDR